MSDSDISNRSRPYAPACDRNREPILEALKAVLPPRGRVLEIGSGTGQHAAFFSRHLPELSWLPSDLPENLPGILEWRSDAGPNCLEPVAVDLLKADLALPQADALVCINTLHIVAWQGGLNLFSAAAKMLPPAAPLVLYGPYRYADRPLEPSNIAFDESLRARDPASGIRSFEMLCEVASGNGFALQEDRSMPANNRLLWFSKIA